ncbi:hypothetical protein [Aquipuribacter hungaricus]|uniref:TrbL/VirB6 plasmid conjugal transfer protein n=1 Tax=Aquipuribacter hungaricus TaxID=545624 RepID=A0ABV7WLP4_9MICO
MGDAIENMAEAVTEAFGRTVASVGTLWVNIGTPNLTASGGSATSVAPGSSAPGSAGIVTVLGYATWIGFVVAGMSLVVLGALVATRLRRGEGFAAVGRIGVVLAAVVLVGGAAGFVSALMPAGPTGVGGTVLFLQSSLWWYVAAAAAFSIVVGGVRMAWEQRAQPGLEIVRSLLTLIVVSGAGVTVVGLLVTAADSFAVWVLNNSLDCDVTGDGGCFGQSLLTLLALTTNPAAGGLGPLLIIILGLVALLASLFQIVLMVARGAMLVILTGVLPLAASATNTELGRSWFRKCVGWLIAFILYKPAAAIVYATAFQLTGTDLFRDDGSGVLAVLTGLMLLVLALFALPALMRFVTPLVGAMAAGGGGAVLAAGALAALPSGAAAVGRLASGAGSGSGGSSGGGAPPAQRVSSESTATGSSQGGSSGGPSTGAGPGGGGPGGSRGPSGPPSTGSTGAAGSTAAASGGVPAAAASAGGVSGAAAGSGAVSAGAAAGAAAGAVGLAVGAAAQAGARAGQAALSAARDVAHDSTGEGSGPDGSR